MSEEITLISLPTSSLEELRCFMCKGYLSCSPLRLLSNGKCICGRCSPLNTETPIHRLVALEVVLSKMSFPCVFKQFGCPETFLFGKTTDHECKCIYKPVACPINTTTTCSWKETASQLLRHFENHHPDFLKDKAEFKLELDKDVQSILMVTVDSFAFIIKYFYNANEEILKYDVRFCGDKNGFDVFSNIQLINATDSDCNANLSTNKCLPYDESFYGMQNATVLKISNYLAGLNDPDFIVVALKLKVAKSNCNNVTTSNDCEVNFGLIKTLKCDKCQNYLIPPLFDFRGKTICCLCRKSNSNCKPSTDTDLLRLVNEAVYPCRWRECNFVGKSNIFKDHEMNCQFRLYDCVYDHCNTTFQLSESADHLKSHVTMNEGSTVYIPGEIAYKTSFTRAYGVNDILTVKNNIIFIVAHEMINSGALYVHRVELFYSGCSAKISAILEFEHEHCKLKSKGFNVSLDKTLEICFKELPSCFKETDELTVTVDFA